jgi:adenylate kinase family enzyme
VGAMTPVAAHCALFHGVTGSGKTSAARAYSRVTGIPAFSADDDLGWLPGWTNRPPADQRRLAAEITARDRWVLDSAYSAWRDIVLDRAQPIVFLDHPRWISLGGPVRRTVRRIVTRERVCNGNLETLRRALARDSIIAWHLRTFRSKREAIDSIRVTADGGAPIVLTFERPRELGAWPASGAAAP